MTNKELKNIIEGEFATNLFQKKEIRKTFHNNEWWFSVIDLIDALCEYNDYKKAKSYWGTLKERLNNENSEVVTKCDQLKMTAPDGKQRETDCINVAGILRLIQEIPTKKAEPFKKWLAKTGFERIQEQQNPDLITQRMMLTYELKEETKDGLETKLKKSDLRDITQDDTTGFEKEQNTGTIYNRFAEILRRYTISDKSNAYNKIFNLFLCKIVDEIETGDDEDLQFQWSNHEDAIDVLSRLNTLYKKGMNEYLQLTITDHEWNEIESKINRLNQNTKQELKNIFTELRLYKNNEFAFQEVIDKTTFEKNAEIVEKVVKLLQPYKLKYSNKQQFLGDFFEKLLNVGIKQENGQFFTPVPIARFINYCIPYEDVIEEKIRNRDANCLPKVIDYACGSGHFLTEAMDRIQKQIDIEAEKTHNNNIQNNLDDWKTKTNGQAYRWAKDFIFGIEKDYRLAKTTKIACFLNSDGDANIFYADGLASFNSTDYSNKIKQGDLDVVVANPPYSVKCFKGVLQNKDFELYDKITSNSSSIECLFVERTKQLLKEGGMCGIILPSSILTNGNVADETRKMFMQHFDLVGIQELFENIFASTGTTTIILFARRHDKTQEYTNIKDYINNFINTQQDFSYNNNNNVIDAYCKYTNTTKEELLQDLTDNDKSLEKLTLFISNYNKKCVISTYDNNTYSGKLGKQFIGFEYSTRKGHEGLHPYPDNATGKVVSQLYTDDNILDDKKVNYYFYNAFRKQYPEIHENLKDNVKYADINDLFNFEKKEFDYAMNTKMRPRQDYANGEKLEKLVVKLQVKQLLANELEDLNITGANEVKLLPSSKNYDWNTTFEKCNNDYNEGEIFTLGQARYANIKYWNGKYISSNNHIFTSIDNDRVLTKYIYYLIKDKTTNFYKKGQQYPQFNFEMFNNFQIPLPPLQTQQQIVEKFDEIEKKQEGNRRKIASNNDKIFEVIDGVGERKEQIIFTDFVKTIQPSIKLQKQEWLSKGDYPIISQETNNLISGYTNNEEAVIKEKPIIAFGDHTLSVKYIDFDFCYGADGMQLLKVDNTKIDTKLFSYILKNRLKEIDDKKYSRHFSKVKMLKFLLPPLQTQQQIVEKFDEIEKKQEGNRRKIEGNEVEILSQIQGLNNVENVKIGDIFECKIGKRVLDKNLLKEGKYKVYSANVFEPFGYLNEPLITDFSKPSILFGIDGDWMVNYIEKDIKFYPTDHCGYLRAKNDEVITKVFTKFIEIAGKEACFSRQKRASIDRVQQIKIPFPYLQTQHQLLQQINQIEQENEELKREIEALEQQKKEFLDKYLK